MHRADRKDLSRKIRICRIIAGKIITIEELIEDYEEA